MDNPSTYGRLVGKKTKDYIFCSNLKATSQGTYNNSLGVARYHNIFLGKYLKV